MKKSKNIKLLKIIAGALLMSAGVGNTVFAEENTSVKYTTPLLPNATDYQLDGDVTLDVNVAEINALEITLSTSNLVIDLTPHIGVPSFDTDTLDILVGTTNTTGYTLTMASSYGGNSTTALTRTESINNTIPTIDTIANITTPTNFASSSDTNSINKWGFMLSTTSLDVDKTVYNPVLTNNTINSSTEAVYNDPTSITFGAKVDSEQPYGNYQATLKFMAVTNAPIYTYNIKFDGNGGTVATTPIVGADDAGTNIALPSTGTYHKAYTVNTDTSYATFAGWSETPNATMPTYTNALTLEKDTDVTLYAVWEFDNNTLQNPNSKCGNNMIDARTGVSYLTYTISGDCYMEQNLYLPMGQTLYAGDSNIYIMTLRRRIRFYYTRLQQ